MSKVNSEENWIIHIDMDAFYAAVEQRDNPQLRGKPVIIGGSPGQRGVVSTASYEARKYGVGSAMSMAEAVRRCPHGIYLRGDQAKYRLASEQIFAIYRDYTPLVEPLALDEAFLDVTGCARLFGSAEKIGREIQSRVEREVELTASVGIGPNKFIAKLASDLKKPNGFVVIPKDKIQKVLYPLPVAKLWGAGRKTVESLNSLGIQTIGDLLKLSQPFLERKYGLLGKQLFFLARGIDYRSVEPEREVKSIGNETTFTNDIWELESLGKTLLELSQQVGRRLRKKGLEGKTITLKLRNHKFETITRSFSFAQSTDLDDDIYETGKALLKENYKQEKIRLIGITISNLDYKGKSGQLSLFAENKDRKIKINDALDKIRDRYGESAVTRARLVKEKEE